MRRTAIVVLLATLGLLAACAGETVSPSVEVTPGVTPEPTTEATPDPTPEPTEGASDGTALPSFDLPDSAPELAALLPDEIGGTQALKLSMSGEEMLAAGGDDATVEPEFQEFLDQVGGDPSSISVAFSFAMSAEPAGVFAFRVEGADEDQLISAFQAAQAAEGGAVDWQSTSIGGKSVLFGEDPETPGTRIYLYTWEDVIFFVTAADEAIAEELVGQLP